MRAKIRPANLPQARKSDLDKVSRQYIDDTEKVTKRKTALGAGTHVSGNKGE